MTELPFLRDLLVLFGLGVVVILLFHRARLPPVIGLLITGVLCGPYGFGLIEGTRQVEAMAELGVVLLLFTVGLELSVEHLVRLRTYLIAGGGLQVLLTLGAVLALTHALGMGSRVGIFLGMLVALSSTAIVVRLLAERGEVDAPHGRSALAILIFQDLCVVPFVLLVPVLAGRGGDLAEVALRIPTALLFIAAALATAHYLVPVALRLVAETRRREVFLLFVLLVCLGAAWASARAGLSLALGAFIAGVVLADSEYSHQALGEVLPLREVFNSLFFISIGMLLDVRTFIAAPLAVLGVIAGVVLLKTVVTGGVTYALGQPLRIAIVTGLALAQIGEFSFVLSKLGRDAGLLDPRLDQLFLAAAVGTMALTPALIAGGPAVAARLSALVPARWAGGRELAGVPRTGFGEASDHVIVIGYGMNGRNLSRVLRRTGIPFVAIDLNPATVRTERDHGIPILYGDATRPEVLEHAGIERARVVVIATSDAAATQATVQLARRLNPAAHIIVRSRYVQEMERLFALGTDEVVPEEFETSIEIFSRVLQRYLIPRDVIETLVREVRGTGYEMFRSLAETYSPAGGVDRALGDLAFAVFRVEPRSALDGVTLERSGLRETAGVTLLAIQQRDGSVVANPAATQRIDARDALLLLGRPPQLAAARALCRAPARADRDRAPAREPAAEPDVGSA